MDLYSKIKLSWRWGMGVYVVSTIVSAVMVGYVIDSPPTIPFGVMLKMLSIPAIY